MNENKEKVLIVGGLWYLGSHISALLGHAGYEIIILDNLSNSQLETLSKIEETNWNKPSFYDVDIRNYKAVLEVFEEYGPSIDYVVHCAGRNSIEESLHQPFLYYETNLFWTINILKAMEKTKIKNLILNSSGEIYDTQNSLPPFSEIDKTNPINPLWTSSLNVENIAKDLTLHKNFNVISLRCFEIIWAHHSGNLWYATKWVPSCTIPYMLKVAKWEIEELTIYWNDYSTKDWTKVRDFVHVMDVAEANLLAMQYIKEFLSFKKDNIENSKGLFDIFNLCLWTGTSVKEILELGQKITEIKIPYKISKRKEWVVWTIIWNPQKAKQVLGWSPKRSTFQAIEDARKYEKRQ